MSEHRPKLECENLDILEGKQPIDISLAGPNDLTRFPASGQLLIFRASELRARVWLIDAATALFEEGNADGFCKLLHAEMYLKDRIGYEMNPPPSQHAVPAEMVRGVAHA